MYHESIDAPDMIKKALSFVSSPVIELPSKNKHVRKYSVVTEDDAEFIHVFKSNVNHQYYVSCQSGLCQHSFGKKRILKRINEFDNICTHLNVFKIWLDSNPIIQEEEEHIGSGEEEDSASGESGEVVGDEAGVDDGAGYGDDGEDDDGGVASEEDEDEDVDKFDGDLDKSKVSFIIFETQGSMELQLWS